MSNTLKCPNCNVIVLRFLPVDFLNGDTLWQCDMCNHKFKTDKNGNIKKDNYGK